MPSNADAFFITFDAGGTSNPASSAACYTIRVSWNSAKNQEGSSRRGLDFGCWTWRSTTPVCQDRIDAPTTPVIQECGGVTKKLSLVGDQSTVFVCLFERCIFSFVVCFIQPFFVFFNLVREISLVSFGSPLQYFIDISERGCRHLLSHICEAQFNDRHPTVRICKYLFVCNLSTCSTIFTEHWYGGGMLHTLIEGGSDRHSTVRICKFLFV
jgi:hypothetical protein